jgi:DNA-binding transcriptional LysR family regulator
MAGVITHRMIKAFRATILNGGISAGADSLGISQPMMSRIITDLQKVVDFPLFVKHGRNVRPTEEALALWKKVQQSFIGLEDITNYSEQLRKQRMGHMSICAIPSIGHSIMPALVAKLRQKYPNLMISLTVASYIDVARAVRNRQADIGFTSDTLTIGELETVGEFTADCVCIGTERWLQVSSEPVTPQDLVNKPFIALSGPFQKRLEAMVVATGHQLDVMVETTLFPSVSELVLTGMGVSVVDPLTGDKHRLRGGVTRALNPKLNFTVYATAMGDTKLSAPINALLESLETAMKSSQPIQRNT